jgi:hypothetical protein
MDNQDIFNKIKSAAENAETKDFPSMEKVWSRIDAKLDTKVEKKQNKNWKVLVVAASIVLFLSIGYQFFKTENQITTPENSLVTIDTTKNEKTETETSIAEVDSLNPLIKKDINKIIEKQNASKEEVVVNEIVSNKNEDAEINSPIAATPVISKSNDEDVITNGFAKRKKLEARGVSYNMNYEVMKEADAVADKIQEPKKEKPLLVIDGEVSKKDLSELDDIEFETFIELPNPLYIINGVHYSEEELFGPNPTSPYAPLKKQKIESTTVLSPENAIRTYGKKGENGVVIIITKDGKPREKK